METTINSSSATAANEMLSKAQQAKSSAEPVARKRSRGSRTYRENGLGTVYNLEKIVKELQRVDSQNGNPIGTVPLLDVVNEMTGEITPGAFTIVSTWCHNRMLELQENPERSKQYITDTLEAIQDRGPKLIFYDDNDIANGFIGLNAALNNELYRIALTTLPMVPDKFKQDGDTYVFVTSKRRLYSNTGHCPVPSGVETVEMDFAKSSGSKPKSYHSESVIDTVFQNIVDQVSKSVDPLSNDANPLHSTLTVYIGTIKVIVASYKQMTHADSMQSITKTAFSGNPFE